MASSWWCLLVLSAVAAVASGQIVFGGAANTASRDDASTVPGTVPGTGRGTNRGTPSAGTGRSCTSPEGAPGVCAPADGCEAIKRRIRLKDTNYIRGAFCERRQGTILLCCADSSRVVSRPSPSVPVARPTFSSTRPASPDRFSSSDRSPTPAPGVTIPSCPRFRSPSDCGRSPFVPSRVVNGMLVRSLGDFPWMAALKYDSSPSFKCGAAILNDRWVITAAHCILNSGPTDVVVGDLNLVTDTDNSAIHPPQTLPVQLSVRHPDYRRALRGGLFNDVALVKLARPIQFSVAVRSICIDSGAGATPDLQGKDTFVAGWGATEFGGLTSPAMQWGRVQVATQQRCRSTYARRGTRVEDSQLCASGVSDRGAVDTCHGDSGGPLMQQRSQNNFNRWYIVGIVSFGSGCAHPDIPGVYTRVSSHLGWIGCTINDN